MKKVILIVLLFIGISYSKDIDQYLNYANQLLNYQFNLNGFNKIKAPFEPEIKIIKINGKKMKNSKILIKTYKVNLLAIFNDKAYVLIKVYIGDQLVEKYKKWIKVGDIIGNCKVYSISFPKIILKCKKRLLIKTLYKKIPGIKEIQ